MVAQTAIGIPQILAIVTICLTLIAFILQIHFVRNEDCSGTPVPDANGVIVDTIPASDYCGVHSRDHVLVAALGANCMSFILVWFTAGSPGDLGSEWVITFCLHTFVAAVLELVFICVAGMGSEDHALQGQSIAAIVIAALNIPILAYLSIHFLLEDIKELIKNVKKLCCLICLILTAIAFACWLSTEHDDRYPWINGIFVAGSLAAALAAIDGLFIGNELSFAFNAIMGSLLVAIFFISAAVSIHPREQTAPLLVAIIFSAINCVVLFVMGQKGKKSELTSKPKLELVLIGITILTILQFSIAMGVLPENTDPGPTGLTWQHAILSTGAASVFAALFFSFIYMDWNARGIHILLALVCYVIFFIADCNEAADMAEQQRENNSLGGTEALREYRSRITALVAAAGNVLLLILCTYLTFPHIPEKEEDDEPQDPPAGEADESA